MITNAQSGTNIHEIVDGIYRINTPVTMPGGSGRFNFNQYLIVDELPLLFHTGLRRLFPLVSEAVAQVMPIEALVLPTVGAGAEVTRVGFSGSSAHRCSGTGLVSSRSSCTGAGASSMVRGSGA